MDKSIVSGLIAVGLLLLLGRAISLTFFTNVRNLAVFELVDGARSDVEMMIPNMSPRLAAEVVKQTGRPPQEVVALYEALLEDEPDSELFQLKLIEAYVDNDQIIDARRLLDESIWSCSQPPRLITESVLYLCTRIGINQADPVLLDEVLAYDPAFGVAKIARLEIEAGIEDKNRPICPADIWPFATQMYQNSALDQLQSLYYSKLMNCPSLAQTEIKNWLLFSSRHSLDLDKEPPPLDEAAYVQQIVDKLPAGSELEPLLQDGFDQPETSLLNWEAIVQLNGNRAAYHIEFDQLKSASGPHSIRVQGLYTPEFGRAGMWQVADMPLAAGCYLVSVMVRTEATTTPRPVAISSGSLWSDYLTFEPTGQGRWQHLGILTCAQEDVIFKPFLSLSDSLGVAWFDSFALYQLSGTTLDLTQRSIWIDGQPQSSHSSAAQPSSSLN